MPSTILSAHALCLGPPWSVQLHRHCARGMTVGTPNRSRRIWRKRASGTWAAAVGTDWTTTPEFAHEDERTWAARKLSCWCSLSRIPRSVRECSMRSAVRALSVARRLAVGRGTAAPVSGFPLTWPLRTLASGTFPSTCPHRAEVATASSIAGTKIATPSPAGGTGGSGATMETNGSCSMPHCPRRIAPIGPSLSAWASKNRAMLSRQR